MICLVFLVFLSNCKTTIWFLVLPICSESWVNLVVHNFARAGQELVKILQLLVPAVTKKGPPSAPYQSNVYIESLLTDNGDHTLIYIHFHRLLYGMWCGGPLQRLDTLILTNVYIINFYTTKIKRFKFLTALKKADSRHFTCQN